MQKKLSFGLILSIPLLLSGCTGYIGNVVAYKNGDIAFGDISSENAYRMADFNTIDKLMASQSEFIFYLSSTTCHACSEFEPVMVEYIQNSKQLVYKMNADVQKDDFEKLYNKYSDYFNGLVGTPAVYIMGDGAGGYQISNSRNSNVNMFSTAMKERLYESNVYSMSKYSSLDSYLSSSERRYVLFYDRSNTEYAGYYNLVLKEVVNKVDKELIIMETSLLSDEDINSVKSLLNMDKLEPLMYARFDNKVVFNHIATNIDEIRHTIGLK